MIDEHWPIHLIGIHCNSSTSPWVVVAGRMVIGAFAGAVKGLRHSQRRDNAIVMTLPHG